MKLLNLGCGNRFMDDWINVDFVSKSPKVVSADLTKGIPFAANGFDLVYHSHVLEHFRQPEASDFMRECFRVLKPGGILRVAVPDLEQVAIRYLRCLGKVVVEDTPLNKADYKWSVIEMYDQAVRTSPGGSMAEYWTQPEIINEKLIIERMGYEYLAFRSAQNDKTRAMGRKVKRDGRRFFSKVRNRLFTWLAEDPKTMDQIRLGRFRMSGEVHQWMYDRYSLGELCKEIGFQTVEVVDAFKSNFPDWTKYQWLDVEGETVRKPDSLFMEAIKGSLGN